MKFVSPILKFSKFRNKSKQLKSVWDKQKIRFRTDCNMGLIAIEGGLLDIKQMNVIYKTVAKYIKPRVRLSKREKYMRRARGKGHVVKSSRRVALFRIRSKEFREIKSMLYKRKREEKRRIVKTKEEVKFFFILFSTNIDN